MTVSIVNLAPSSNLALRRTLLTRLISATLPPDTHFEDAWRVYEHALVKMLDLYDAMSILKALPNLKPELFEQAETEYQAASDALGGAIKALLNAPCIRPCNMRRKLQLAISEDAGARDVVSILDDLEALQRLTRLP